MRKIKFFVILAFVFFVFAFGVNADTLGQSQRFFISPQYDAQSRASVNATLRHVSGRAYFYVADDYWSGASEFTRSQTLTQIEAVAKEFDGRIYPIETQFFGSEPNPGIDNDSHITILLAPLIENAGGYFDTANQYPTTEAPNSNQREIIYLNVSELPSQSKMFAFLAHEFQHLISFNQKEKLRNVSDDVWLNELRSEYAVSLLGYNDIYDGSHLQKRARAFLSDPSDSLTEWKNLPADYGQIGMFGEYIAEHWSPQVIAGTLETRSAGFNSLGESLTVNGFGDGFLAVYRDWLIANIVNDSSANPRWGYARAGLKNLRFVPSRVISNLADSVVFAVTDPIKDWQGKWYEISGFSAGQNDVLKVDFTSSSLASFHVAYIVVKSDGSRQVFTFEPRPRSSTLYISGLNSDVSKIILIPTKKDKLSGFGLNEEPVQLTLTMERILAIPENTATLSPLASPPASPAPANNVMLENNFADGTLIRAKGDIRVYVVKGKWRRHIMRPEILGFYPGLRFDKVLEVESSVLNQYQESNLVRYAGSRRVYEIDSSGLRRWLNMGGEQFGVSGRAWDSIFTINNRELNFYRRGPDIGK